MVWNKDNPQGSNPLKTSDDLIRDNNAALEDALNREHSFSTAGSKTGRHKFQIGALADREAYDILKAPQNGAVYIRTDLVPFDDSDPALKKRVVDIYDDSTPGGGWIDQTPPVYPDVPTQRSKGEWGLYETITPEGAPLVANWDWDDSNAFKVTLAGDTTLNYPSGNSVASADRWQPVVLHVTQGGGGNHTLSFQSATPGFRAAFGGVTLAIAPTGTSLLTFQLLPDQWILVTTLPDLGTLT